MCVRVCVCVGKQLMLAVGDSGGTLHILEVPWSLSHVSTNEVYTWLLSHTHTHTRTHTHTHTQVSIMKSFFDREVHRLDSTTQRMAVRAAEKREVDATKTDTKKVSSGNPHP